MPDPEPAPARPANRLAGETSPYLLQHAHNPVDWWPWGPAALTRAKLLDRPIFLSIGYAACHWCHVMERETFEDERLAAYLNEHFISIKVDREERPDLDQVYMGAVQALTGSGGWPMSVFLTPEGRPFYGGTYFPPEPRHGLPSFRQVLEGVARVWLGDRAGVEGAGLRLASALVEGATPHPAPRDGVTADLLQAAEEAAEAAFDPVSGGWGGAPKFPQPMTIEFLLDRALATAAERPLVIVRRALTAMAEGGIHDHVGGGFHRYATDGRWLVPHFEKMLYDNALLARAYWRAWAATGDPAFRTVGERTLAYLHDEMRTADGAFAASQDADTGGVEGATFTWTPEQVRAAIPDDLTRQVASAVFGIRPGGNWEGVTILSRVRSDAEVAQDLGLEPVAVAAAVADAVAALAVARATRAQPTRDDKALASWNGLAIGAFAEAARILRAAGDPASAGMADDHVATAIRAAGTVISGLVSAGRVRRSWKDGRATADGILEDHANLADGLLRLYRATFDERWFAVARDLADTMLDRFADPAGGFFDTADDHERLISRPKDLQDNATPSGGSVAASVLLRLEAMTGEARYGDAARRAISGVAGLAVRHPTAFAMWLQAAALSVTGITEVAIVGSLDGADAEATAALLAVADPGAGVGRVVVVGDAPGATAIPLLAGRTRIDGRPTAYVCRQFACRLPVTDPAALLAQLREHEAAG